MNGLACCAGIGGLELALKLALPHYRTVCYVEREAFAAATLAARMVEGALDTAPLWDDLRTFDARPWRGVVDLVSAGYPCQPFSVAGRGRGEADERHLWPHVRRVVSECEPSLVFCENVPPHLSRGFDKVALDLRGLGYRVAAVLLRASDVGAPHKRERLFFLGLNVADFNGEGRQQFTQQHGGAADGRASHRNNAHGCDSYVADAREFTEREQDDAGGSIDGRRSRTRQASVGGGASVVDTDGAGRDERSRDVATSRGWDQPSNADSLSDAERDDLRQLAERDQRQGRRVRETVGEYAEPRNASASWGLAFPPGPTDADGWQRFLEREPCAQPAVCRSADGLTHRLDELRALGNAVVPQVAALAFGLLYSELQR